MSNTSKKEKEKKNKQSMSIEDFPDEVVLQRAEEIKTRIRREALAKAALIDLKLKKAMKGRAKFKLADLVFSAEYRCECGSGMAFPIGCSHKNGFWLCGEALLGIAKKGDHNMTSFEYNVRREFKDGEVLVSTRERIIEVEDVSDQKSL